MMGRISLYIVLIVIINPTINNIYHQTFVYIKLNQTIKSMSGGADQFDLQSQYSQPLPERSQFNAEAAAVQVIDKIINRAIHRIERNAKFKDNLRKFSNIKTIKNIDEMSNLNFYQSKIYFSGLSSHAQPRALYIDSLLPISAEVDKQNTYKLRLKNMVSSEISEIGKKRKQSPNKQQKKDDYMKLDFEKQDIEQDGFTKQLRKMQEDKQSKERNERKIKDNLQRQEREKLKQKKKEKEERFSFDYNGSAIKLKAQNRVNLISKLINGNTNPKTNVNKQAINDPNPQTVDSVVLGKKKNLSNLAIRKKDEIQFQQNRTLAQGVTVKQGIKYTFQGKTIETKMKSFTAFQLKKTLKDRRLTKEQYQKIRALNGSSLQLQNQTDFRQTKQKRSQSQAKLTKVKERLITKQKIVINNQNLKQKMLQKVNQLMEPKQKEQDPEKPYEFVGQTDIFNMNYLKNGKSMQSLSTERSLMLLPRIGKINQDKQVLPKQRERIKQKNTIIYEIRKKFDDKLKY